MSDTSWVLRGIEPEARQRAEEEAARLGVSVGDYLTDMVVRRALIDQLNADSEGEPPQVDAEAAAIFAPAPESSEGFAVRHRLKALERRLSSATGSLDGAISALDTSLFDITARIGDVEALAGDTAHALGQTQQEVNNAVTGLQLHLAVIEDNISVQGEALGARCEGIDHRLDRVESVAYGAERSAAVLADAHETLKRAVAEDFATFTHETADQLNESLADVRADADAATEQADAAVAHLINELRGLRSSIEDRLEESEHETRRRMHAAFAEAAERMAALADRVGDNERMIHRAAEQLRGEMADVEDSAQTMLEQTAETLRHADASLAADIARTANEGALAVDAARAELSAQIGAVHEDHVAQLARLKTMDVALGNTINGLAELRTSFDRRLGEVEDTLQTDVAHAKADWAERFDNLGVRVARGEQAQADLRQQLSAETDRVEACTFAALEKLRRDISAGDAETMAHVHGALAPVRAQLDEVRTAVSADIHLLREEHTGALARLTLLDGAMARLEAAANPEFEARLTQLENAVSAAEFEQAVSVLREEIAALATRHEALAADPTLSERIAALQEQIATQDAQSSEALQGVMRMLNRVASQSVETSARTEERAHQIEVALADLRLQALSHEAAPDHTDALAAIEQRVAAFEQKQASALEALRTDIARFVADNDRRFEALEEPKAAADTDDLITQFEDLRRRIEERVLGVELRSVRTLEQVVDTVSLLEQRLLGADQAEQTAKSA